MRERDPHCACDVHDVVVHPAPGSLDGEGAGGAKRQAPAGRPPELVQDDAEQDDESQAGEKVRRLREQRQGQQRPDCGGGGPPLPLGAAGQAQQQNDGQRGPTPMVVMQAGVGAPAAFAHAPRGGDESEQGDKRTDRRPSRNAPGEHHAGQGQQARQHDHVRRFQGAREAALQQEPRVGQRHRQPAHRGVEVEVRRLAGRHAVHEVRKLHEVIGRGGHIGRARSDEPGPVEQE